MPNVEKKPKIVAYSNLYPLPWEPGRATFNRQQFQFLSDYFEINVLVPVAWTNYLSAQWQYRKEPPVQMQDTLPTKYFCYFFIPKIARWSYAFTQFISALMCIPQLVGKKRPDMILATWVYPDAMAAVLLGKLLKIPVMVKVHGSDINENTLLPGVRRQISWTLAQADGVLAVSQDLADKVIQLGADVRYTQVIYNGVELHKFSPSDKTAARKNLQLDIKQSVILYIGNLKVAKGCVDLLEGFALMLKKQAGVKLIYVGAGPCADEIKQRAEILGIADAVQLAGPQPHTRLPEWIAAADLVSLPSHNEGVPNVLLEAMACGRPVVATAVGGIPEIVPEFAGFLVARGDINNLARHLHQALQQPWQVSAIVEHASQYTWQRNSAQFNDLFKQVEGR